MAVGLLIEIPGGTQQHYDEAMKHLGLDGPNPIWPAGLQSHIAGPMEGGWRVVDVWDSEEAFHKFVKKRLSAAGQAAGLPPLTTTFFPVHRMHP